MFSNIIFDLDGTLIDSADDIIFYIKIAIEAFPELGKVNIDRTEIGPPLRKIINNILPNINEEIQRKIVDKFRKYYFGCDFARTKLFDGVERVLSHFSENGVDVYIATNKPLAPTKRILHKLNLTSIKQIVTVDCLAEQILEKKNMINKIINDNDLQKEKVLMVGDSASDINAAKENTIKSVAFLGGYGSKKELLLANPEYKIKNMIEIISLLKSNEEEYEYSNF